MTVAGKFSNADAIFIGVRSCFLLPSHRNNLVEDQVCAVEKWAISWTPWINLCLGYRRCHWKVNSCVVHCLYAQLCCIRTFRKMFLCLRRSHHRESDCMDHVSPVCAIFLAELCNPSTRQAIELESCSNALQIQQVFDCSSKKIFFVLSLRCSGGNVTSRGVFVLFWPPFPGPGRRTNGLSFRLKDLLKTRSNSASIETLIDFPAYREGKGWLINQIWPKFCSLTSHSGGDFTQAITRRQIELESCSNPPKTREDM